MTTQRAIVTAALDAVREVVAAYNRSRSVTMDFSQAQLSLIAAVSSSDQQVEFLRGLAAAHHRGEVPLAAYHKILLTVGRLLKGSAALTSELERIVRMNNEG